MKRNNEMNTQKKEKLTKQIMKSPVGEFIDLPVLAPPPQPQQPPTSQFAKYCVHIMIPCYGGQMSEATAGSLFRFVTLAQQVGLRWGLDTMANESLISRGRNNLISRGMFHPQPTHFFFIDADIRFNPESILQLLLDEKDVIGGLYPKKGLPIDYNFNIKQGGKIEGQLVEVDTLATGFMMIKREVIEKMFKEYPDTKYIDDVGIGKEFEPFMYALFDTLIDSKGHYLSEDWTFCRRWAAMGGEIWADTRILLDHIGYFSFSGDLSALENKGIKMVPADSPEAKAWLEAQAKKKEQENGTK